MYFLLYLLPKNWVSRCVGWAVARRWPWNLHRRLRDAFIRHFRVNVEEAEFPLDGYATLSAFFTRRLRPGSRPVGRAALVSPVDGTLTERGHLGTDSDLFLTQIKGRRYSLRGLVGEEWNASGYAGGSFFTLYLAPWNYHRIHVPAAGRVLRVRRIPGRLWPVNSWSVRNIPELFVRNERIVTEMDCEGGRLLLVLIGATNVGKITLDFCPQLVGNAPARSQFEDWIPPPDLHLEKGSGFGCFAMGSTVVLVLDADWTPRVRPEWWSAAAATLSVGMNFSL